MLSVSILDIKTDEKLKKLDELDFDYIHVDVMDNKFVPNITKDFEKLKDFSVPYRGLSFYIFIFIFDRRLQ